MFSFRTWAVQTAKRTVTACLRGAFALCGFVPLNDRRILLCSYAGEQYTGNLKCMSEYLLEHYGQEVELVWAFRRPEKFRDIPGIRTVKLYSLSWFYAALTARVVVTNTGFLQALRKRKGQLFLDTWHGGGAYKRVGLSLDLSRAEARVQRRGVAATDVCLSSSRLFTHYSLREDRGYEGEVLNCGMPRNDIFFSTEARERAAGEVRRALGLSGYVVLYAPTYRGPVTEGSQLDFGFPYEAVLTALRKRIKGPVTLLKRAHWGCRMADSSPEEVVDVSDWPDMQQLLCAADMLITDYSSCIWDYALLERPCLLYQTDLAAYERDRGVCTPVEQWPGIVCRSDEELLDAISAFDEGACGEKAREHLRAMGSYETGTATAQACGRIMEHIRETQAEALRPAGDVIRMEQMKNIAVIFAGGTGERMEDHSVPKQFLTVGDKPVLAYTLEQFQRHEQIDGIVLVVLREWQDYCGRMAARWGLDKLKAVVAGG